MSDEALPRVRDADGNWHTVGDFAFTDRRGNDRFRGRSMNLFGCIEDVLDDFSPQHQRGATVYVYKTVDGLFMGSVVPHKPAEYDLADWHGAELVHIQRGGRSAGAQLGDGGETNG